MIVIDTHVWVWWVNQDSRLTASDIAILTANESVGIGVPSICLWEIAMLANRGTIRFSVSTEAWLHSALLYPGMQVLHLTPEIAADSVSLPGAFHKDPADRLIVATARVHNCPLLSRDGLIAAYPHVLHAKP